jgi:AraC-like DNA-binding protein
MAAQLWGGDPELSAEPLFSDSELDLRHRQLVGMSASADSFEVAERTLTLLAAVLGRRAVAISPHHLSRIFSERTGETISRYRNRIRVRLALERLARARRRSRGWPATSASPTRPTCAG